MRLFAKNKKMAGWMAFVLDHAEIRVASVKRAAQSMPSVESIASYALGDGVSEKLLEKIGKDLHAENYECTTLLSPSEYQLLSVEAPPVPREELKTAIRWRLKDMLDFRVEDATIDVLDVPVSKDAPVRSHSMYAVAARNQVIEKRQTLFAEAKISLRAIDIPDVAQRNISALLEPEGRGVALLSFDADGGLLTVTFGGELYLSRKIDVSLAQLNQATGDEKNAIYDKITLELQRSLDHFDRQYHFVTLGKLFLAPMSEEGVKLQEYLASNLYIPVDTFKLETILDLSKVPELKATDMQQRYFLTLGAALRLEEKVL